MSGRPVRRRDSRFWKNLHFQKPYVYTNWVGECTCRWLDRGCGNRKVVKGRMKRIATLATGVALLMPATALGADSSASCQTYSNQTCTPINRHQTTAAGSDGTLPFTGLDVALLAVGGGTLLGAGYGVRRLSSRGS